MFHREYRSVLSCRLVEVTATRTCTGILHCDEPEFSFVASFGRVTENTCFVVVESSSVESFIAIRRDGVCRRW